MTRKKRIEAAILHQQVDRIPTDFWATPEIQEMMCDYFVIEEGKHDQSPWIGLNGGPLSRGIYGIVKMMDKLDIDGIFDVHPPYIGPEKREEKGIVFNEWGFGYKEKRYAEGTYMEQIISPLTDAKSIEDIEAFPWPDPDWYDYSKLPGLIEQCGERAVNVGYSAIFTFHNYLRGLEQSLTDPMLHPELTRAIISRISGFFQEYHKRCFEEEGALISVSQVTDDWGSQHGLVTSPDVFEEFYREPTQQAIDLVKKFNIAVFHHDDGDCRPLIPTLIDMGIDILNPVQWRCGDWDLKKIKANFGSEVCFHSGVDNQSTLPYGTPDQVSEEVKMLINTLASDGTGFILGPCHNLQPNTTVENILAMYNAAGS